MLKGLRPHTERCGAAAFCPHIFHTEQVEKTGQYVYNTIAIINV